MSPSTCFTDALLTTVRNTFVQGLIETGFVNWLKGYSLKVPVRACVEYINHFLSNTNIQFAGNFQLSPTLVTFNRKTSPKHWFTFLSSLVSIFPFHNPSSSILFLLTIQISSCLVRCQTLFCLVRMETYILNQYSFIFNFGSSHIFKRCGLISQFTTNL